MKRLFARFCHWITNAVEKRLTPFIIAVLILSSCEKSECAPPEITGIVGNVAHFKPAGQYLIEMEGLDNPYKGTITVTGTSYKLEGEKYRIRIRSACSEWSEWFYKP